MKCHDFEELISDYIDGHLTGEIQSQFAAHQLACPECRSLVAEVRSAITFCRSEEPAAMRPAFEAQVLSLTQDARLPLELPQLDCAGCEDLITEFLDGFVPAPVYHAFELHVGACSPCSTLLTDTVYAVAACHSVHSAESFEVSEALVQRILAATSLADVKQTIKLPWRERAYAFFEQILHPLTVPQWATAMAIILASTAVLLLQFSDDHSLTGVYRQGNVMAGRAYQWTADVIGRRNVVVDDVKDISHQVTDTIKDGLNTIDREQQSGADQSAQPNGAAAEPSSTTNPVAPAPEKSKTQKIKPRNGGKSQRP